MKVRRFPQKKNNSSAAGRLPMFSENKKKNSIKQSTKKSNENRKLAIEKNDLLKVTMFQRHKDYYGFVKTGFEKRAIKGASAMHIFSILAPLGRFGYHF